MTKFEQLMTEKVELRSVSFLEDPLMNGLSTVSLDLEKRIIPYMLGNGDVYISHYFPDEADYIIPAHTIYRYTFNG
ncbi:hypothetical protein [Lactococcus lactis]|uniref:hypothetical protein n=1 Tax=Lactococcus lactis TaxID=1358 RepID=UPI00300E2A62